MYERNRQFISLPVMNLRYDDMIRILSDDAMHRRRAAALALLYKNVFVTKGFPVICQDNSFGLDGHGKTGRASMLKCITDQFNGATILQKRFAQEA